ncbi:restriction endonuclease subunit S [Agrobacterium sp. 22-214-1]
MSRDVPGGWRSVRLGEVAREDRSRNSDGKIPSERLVGVFKNDGMIPMRERVKGVSVDRCKIVQPGSFAYNPMRINIGSIARSSHADAVMVSPDYVVFSANERMLDGSYLEHLRRSAEWEAYVGNAGDGGVRIRIYFDHLAEFRFALPPLHEQRRIADILSSVDEAIASTRSVMEQTRKVKQGVLERLLTKGIGHTRFKQTGIGEIPEGWEIVRLNHIAERTTYGFTNPMSTVEDGPWMITAANILEGKINYKTARKTDRIEFETLLSEKSKPAENTVLITKDGTLGRVAIVDKGDLCINQSVAAVTPIEWRILPRFLYWLLQSPSVQTRILAEAGGSTIKHIYISKLAETVLQLPPLNEQEEIVRNIDLVELSFEREHSHFGALVAFKAALMSDLLTGRKRVTDALPMAAE